MKVRLVSHSSAIIECSDLKIWTDPWLIGKAFNDSWTLYPPPSFEESLLADVDYLWISHEHPDHFSVPTLRSLPDEFKQRVTVLFQENNSDKMLEAFEKFGYPKRRTLPHDKTVSLSAETEIYCYQVGQMDSCLGVRNRGEIVFNINDALLSHNDAAIVRKNFGQADVVLNQFSVAGYPGFEDYERIVPEMAGEHLTVLIQNHRDLGARITVPFASFMLYSSHDNKHLNAFGNRPKDVADRFQQEGEDLAVLYPGDTLDTNLPHDSSAALARFDRAYAELDDFDYDPVKTVSLDEIRGSFAKRVDDLHDKYPKLLLSRLAPVTVWIPDLETAVRFRLATREFAEFELGQNEKTDLVVYSQPFLFTFAAAFGVQTLGVSARVVLRQNTRNSSLHRVLFSLYNAEIYLRPRYLFTRRNLRFLAERRHGLLGQFRARLAEMAKGF